MLHPIIAEVTGRIIERSRDGRRAYLDKIIAAKQQGVSRNLSTNIPKLLNRPLAKWVL